MAGKTESPDINSDTRKDRRAGMQKQNLIKILGIGIAVLAGALILYFLVSPLWSGSDIDVAGSNIPPVDEEEMSMLPQMTRFISEEDTYAARDPFAEPGQLVGIIKCSDGVDLAIIETSRANYVAAVGDIIDDHWVVAEIRRDSVILEAQGEVLTLSLRGRGELEEVTEAPEEEVEEPDDEEEEEEEPEEEEDDAEEDNQEE